MKHFKINPMVLAMAVALPAAVHAQQNETIEEVVVTGSYRASLATSLETKRNAANAVDSINAQDIADFPDNNLAESLQRIPGVAITRSGGEGRNISVRGLGPDYTRVRVNGMESISTTGGTDATGGTNRGRGFDFNTFSSDLFSSLTVNKTAMAEIEEGSLGATVDLNSAKPFNYDGFVFSASAQAGYNDLSEETDPSAAFLVSNIFADGKIGALLSLSYSERTIKDEGSSTVRWANPSSQAFGFVDGTAVDATHEVNTAFHPRIPRYDSFTHDMSRLGASASIQFRPTDVTEVSLDVLYAEHEATRQEVFLEASMNGSQNANVNVLDYEIVGNSLAYAQFEDVRLLAENRFDEMKTEFHQVTLSVTHEFTDNLSGSLLIGTAESEFDNPIQNTAIIRAEGQEFAYDFRNGRRGDFVFGDGAYLPASWTLTELRQRPQGSSNAYDNFSAQLEYRINDALTLKGGVNYKEFEFSTYQKQFADEAAGPITLGADDLIRYDSGLGSGPAWLVPDRGRIMAANNVWDRPYRDNTANSYDAVEETVGGFLQLDFDTTIGNTPVRGNIGVRHYSTDQSTSGWVSGDQVWVDHSYDDILPSANLSFEPIEDVVIRLAYSEGIARAGLGSIKADTSVNVAGTNMTVTGANPFLEPTKAKSYDVGVELYFDNESALGIALFRKDLESQVQTLRTTRPFTEIAAERGLDLDLATDACNNSTMSPADCNVNAIWNYSIPLNAPGGDVYGFELSYQTPFSFLPGFLSDFGFIGSYTYVKGQIDYLNSDGQVELRSDLENMSVNTSSATLYYEKDAFNARVSLASRSGYLTNARGRDGNNAEGTSSTHNVDASLSYQINDSWKVSLEALNLTNEADDQWVDENDRRLSYYHETGRQYYLGVQYKY